MEHEFDASVGILPIDSYYKGVALGGGLRLALSPTSGPSRRTSTTCMNIDHLAARQAGEQLRDPAHAFRRDQVFGELGALFKPLYGKLSFLNKTLVYGEFYFSLTGVVARMEGGKKTEGEPEGKAPRMAFGGAPGFGLRGYLHKYISVRFDFRQMILYSQGEMHYPLSLTLSFGFTTQERPMTADRSAIRSCLAVAPAGGWPHRRPRARASPIRAASSTPSRSAT